MTTLEEVQKLFAYEHLPPKLQEVGQPIRYAAVELLNNLPPSAERTLALRKLWEAKNYAVWCAANA